METIEKIKELTESLSIDAGKFYKGNKSAGTRARGTAQELKETLQNFRKEILEERKKENDYYRYIIFIYINIFDFDFIENYC